MKRFVVEGPLPVPCHKGKGGRTITDENVLQFWSKNSATVSKKGCYVFAVRAGKGVTPGYVGMATRGFKREVFAPHKVMRYQQFLAEYAKGTPVLYFVVDPVARGAPNKTRIRDLERFLIQVGVAANSELLNIQGTKAEEWGIAGVLRGGGGKPSKAAQSFKSMMAIK